VVIELLYRATFKERAGCHSGPIDLRYAVEGFYALHASAFLAEDLEDERLAGRVRRVLRPWERRLARAFADYITLICAGEARHGRSSGPGYIPAPYMDSSSYSRERVYFHATRYDPVALLEGCHALFARDVDFGVRPWHIGYGGHSWARIARAGLAYWREVREGELSVATWVDHVVNLTHNGGLMFNKPTGHFGDYVPSDIIDFLNLRATAPPEKIVSRVLRRWASQVTYKAGRLLARVLAEALRLAARHKLLRPYAVLKLYKQHAAEFSRRDAVMMYVPVDWGDDDVPEIVWHDYECEDEDGGDFGSFCEGKEEEENEENVVEEKQSPGKAGKEYSACFVYRPVARHRSGSE
jgi:hypothetical protein